ncbi:MAG TPA: FadR family transcriptional regulator [Firmicutes bacterium]|nr:FadR family transcriptional regulator [Bacillota bacterium]
MSVTKQRNKSRYKAIASQLLQMINDHVYSPGSRLPAERVLAKEFGVSRSTIREAIHCLESMGCVEIRVGSGSYVKTPDRRHIAQDAPRDLLRGDLRNCDVIEARAILDAEIGALAATRRTEEHLAALEENVLAMGREYSQAMGMEEYIRLDTEFHLLLAKASQNAALEYIAELCRQMYDYTIRLSFTVQGMPGTGYRQHWEILQAIRQRNSQQARELIRQHILHTLYRQEDNC